MEVIVQLAFETEYTKMFAVTPAEEKDDDIRKKRYGKVFVETGIYWPADWTAIGCQFNVVDMWLILSLGRGTRLKNFQKE